VTKGFSKKGEKMAKILINLPQSLVEEIDSLAKEQGVSRSFFIRESLWQVLRIKHKLEVEEKMKLGYQEMSEINLEWAQLGLMADEMALKAYEAALSEDEIDDTQR
jgi:CopG family transcriptional regulator/antitoxin EndoAI